MILRPKSFKKILIGGLTLAVVLLAGGALYAQRVSWFSRYPRTAGRYGLGERYRMKLDLELTLRMSRAPEQHAHLTGVLLTTPVDMHDGVVELEYKIEQTRVSLESPGMPASGERASAEREMATGLSRTFYVRHRLDGAAIAVQFERGYNPALSNVLMTVVGNAQLVRGDTAAPTWTSVERDVNGEYLAAYADLGASKVTKRKLKYINNDAAPAAGAGLSKSLVPQVKIEAASFDILASEQFRFTGTSGVERTLVSLGQTGITFDTELKLKLEGCVVEHAPGAIDDYAHNRDNFVLQPVESISEDPRVRQSYEDRMVLKSAGLEEVWAALSALPATANAQQSADVVRQLQAMFRLDERTIARALERLPTLPASNAKFALDAFTLAGTLATQNALAHVAGDEHFAPILREYAIRYLGHQQVATPESLAALRKLIDDANPQRRQMARFAYGTLATRSSQQPERAREIVSDLLAREALANNESERSDLYLALGNTASADALPVLKRAAAENHGRLQLTAIEALGRIADPAVVEIMQTYLGHRDEAVRIAAINGVQRRELGPFFPALVELAKHDKSIEVRGAAIELLGSQLGQVPSLRTALADVAKNDPEPKVREAAARQLSEQAAPKSG